MFQKWPEEEITLTAIELYNNEFISLKDRTKIFPKEYNGRIDLENYEPEIATIDNLREMVKIYTENRTENETKGNRKSSRSHAIFKIYCDYMEVAIVDLAGSQRLDKVSTNFQETTCINKGLLALGKCLHAFRDGTMVPFRESKLTKLLCEYFGSHYKIFMIAHINRTGEMFH